MLVSLVIERYNVTDAASEVSWSIVSHPFWKKKGRRPPLNEMFTPEYIVGLVDGEGSFTVYIRDPGSSDARVRRVKAEPKFYLKLIEKDKEILDGLKEYFRCGNVYFQKDRRKNHQQCYRYEVANRSDLERVIIPFFKRYPPRFPSKSKDFKIFCELVEMMGEGSHLKQAGLVRMYALKQQMH